MRWMLFLVACASAPLRVVRWETRDMEKRGFDSRGRVVRWTEVIGGHSYDHEFAYDDQGRMVSEVVQWTPYQRTCSMGPGAGGDCIELIPRPGHAERVDFYTYDELRRPISIVSDTFFVDGRKRSRRTRERWYIEWTGNPIDPVRERLDRPDNNVSSTGLGDGAKRAQAFSRGDWSW